MKIDLHQLANQAIRIGGPIVLAAIAHKMATNKPIVGGAASTGSDLKTVAVEMATAALSQRLSVVEQSLAMQAGQ
ncbi:hypothetical protein [Sphingomonas sp. CROZ-RG-20F-R02-07]|uniref:hypothetical protein n=1 Tax=Sphingomonas sp. CROZ-RG-20F-R02-07 TaxID=2914832 RepID=UPI001F58C341|nr:hypothetical protein [Sphingomonas sp. CROZ-RG-20F-R02-07]